MVAAPKTSIRTPPSAELAGWAILIGAFFGGYFFEFLALASRWIEDPDYAHGFLVGPFAIYLLWARRELMPAASQGTAWGLVLLGVGGLLRGLSTFFLYYDNLDPFSLWLMLAGVGLLLGGWQALRWSWPSILFLIFMIPLPGPVASMLGYPLQRIGTVVSTYLLQTCGIPAVDQGVTIKLSSIDLEVAQACSGLKMLTLFVAVCIGAALLMKRPLWEKLVVVFSAPPIAVISNVARITVTGILCETTGADVKRLHDFAGWGMMPLAVLLIWGEMGLLSRFFVSEDREAGIWAP
jgi:exosortase